MNVRQFPAFDFRLFKDRHEAWDALAKAFTCDCESFELRRRPVRGGGVQFVNQCRRCGRQVGTAQKKDTVNGSGNALPLFNEDYERGWSAEWQRVHKEIKEHFADKYKTAYYEYLDSEAWKEKRRKVMVRASGVCEGCNENKATQVHHLTYVHVGDELLFELVAVCDECHEKAHAEEA